MRPWTQLTTGAPAALTVPHAARAGARALAALQGSECATLGSSTFHLFWDLGETFAEAGLAIYVDAGAYPIATWGIERAAARGTPVRRFAHHDANALWNQLREEKRKLRPIVVCDGFCPGCGRPAPLSAYLKITAQFGGWLVVDDTQALGILGHSAGGLRPYGEGGGGMLRWSSISDPRLVVVASLAKAFGAPLAALSGSEKFVKRFEERSATRVHCSPPSLAAIRAMERALAVNRACGDALRSNLAKRVRHFRARLREAGLAATGGLFPVQTLATVRGWEAPALHDRLLRAGVSAVLHQRHQGPGAGISFLINGHHTFNEIDQAVDVLAEAAADARPTATPRQLQHEQHLSAAESCRGFPADPIQTQRRST